MREIKTDRRSRYTRMVVRNALLELLKEKPINKITVSAICEKADINRGTFYIHFYDVFDLMEQVEREFFDDVIANVEEVINVDNDELDLTGLFKTISENADLCTVLFSKDAEQTVFKKLIYSVKDKCIAGWRALNGELPEQMLEKLFSFISNGSVGMIEDWVRDGMKEKPDAIGDSVRLFASGCVQSFLLHNHRLSI